MNGAQLDEISDVHIPVKQRRMRLFLECNMVIAKEVNISGIHSQSAIPRMAVEHGHGKEVQRKIAHVYRLHGL
jgi:hypothetical protein